MDMYKLLHKLFGWDYIAWQNSADQGIARVLVDGRDRPFYFQYRNIALAKVINSSEDVLWLTCPPYKYLRPRANQALFAANDFDVNKTRELLNNI